MTLRTALFASALALCLSPTLPVWAQDTGATQEMAAPITVGSIEITAPFTRATLPNAPVGGGFLTISNTGTEDDRLVSADADFAGSTQIHEMSVVDGVMKMGQLKDGLPIAAGETVTLAPGGYHIMFMGLKQKLVEGETVPVMLTFEKAGAVTLELPVAGIAADAPMAMDHTKMEQ